MTLPFNGVKDFFHWAGCAVAIMIVAVFVVIVGVAFYLLVPEPDDSGGNDYGYPE